MTRFLLPFLLVGCGTFDPCDGVQDLSSTPLGVELTSSEHPGWGSDACFQCHSVVLIHRASCMTPDVDVDAINADIDVNNTQTCTACHGTNGLPEETP